MAVPYPPARRFEAKRGEGADIESAGAQRRYLPRGPALVAVAVVSVSLCCFAALVAGPGRTEDVSVDAANGGASGVPRDAERLIQRAVRKAVAVSCSLAIALAGPLESQACATRSQKAAGRLCVTRVPPPHVPWCRAPRGMCSRMSNPR